MLYDACSVKGAKCVYTSPGRCRQPLDRYRARRLKPTSAIYRRFMQTTTSSSAFVQLPKLTREVELLRLDYKRHHYVFFNPDFEVFLRDTKTALDAHQLPHRVFDEIFSDSNLTPHPSCNGSALHHGKQSL